MFYIIYCYVGFMMKNLCQWKVSKKLQNLSFSFIDVLYDWLNFPQYFDHFKVNYKQLVPKDVIFVPYIFLMLSCEIPCYEHVTITLFQQVLSEVKFLTNFKVQQALAAVQRESNPIKIFAE